MTLAAVQLAPDVDAFMAGVEMGLYGTFAAVSALIVVATIRRALSV